MRFLSDLRFLLLSAAVLLFLTACAGAQPNGVTEEDFISLEQRGILSLMNPETAENFTLYEVRLGSIAQELTLQASLHFPVVRHLYFERTDGYFSGVFVQAGQQVEAGDVLAELTFETELLEIERYIMQNTLNQFETRFAEEENRMRAEIAAKRYVFELSYGDAAWEQMALELEQLELTLRRFIFDSHVTRQYHRRALANLDEAIAPAQIIAPFSGVVTSISQTASGTFINNWPRVVTIADDSVLRFTVPGIITGVRFGDTFPLRINDYTMDVRVVSDPLLTGRSTSAQQITLAPVEPNDLTDFFARYEQRPYEFINASFIAMPGIIYATDSVIVHSRAVIHDDSGDYVFIYHDGRLMKRYVTTGAVLGTQVEILSGLMPGQMVVLP